jgi:hypothetical protein
MIARNWSHEMADEAHPPVDVVFIAGFGRSGSTLLAQVLGQLPGFVSVGELRHLWLRGVVENQLCGCGEPFRSCAFWRKVADQGFGGVSWESLADIAQLQTRVDAIRLIPQVFFEWMRSAAYRSDLREYCQKLASLFRGIHEASGKAIIVDSSKTPMHGRLLLETPGVRLHVIHLTRDSRAVAYSWQRKKERPEIHWKQEVMPRYGALKSAMWWNGANATAEWLARRAATFVQFRYEDFLKSPRATLSEFLQAAHFPGLTEGLLAEGQIEVGVQHTVAGNPGRFRTGKVALKPDNEWQASYRGASRAVVDALTFPWLWRYGYRLAGK